MKPFMSLLIATSLILIGIGGAVPAEAAEPLDISHLEGRAGIPGVRERYLHTSTSAK